MNINEQDKMLYRHYAETGPVDNPQIWDAYRALRKGIQYLPQGERIAILELSAALANAQEHATFLAGLQLGRQGY